MPVLQRIKRLIPLQLIESYASIPSIPITLATHSEPPTPLLRPRDSNIRSSAVHLRRILEQSNFLSHLSIWRLRPSSVPESSIPPQPPLSYSLGARIIEYLRLLCTPSRRFYSQFVANQPAFSPTTTPLFMDTGEFSKSSTVVGNDKSVTAFKKSRREGRHTVKVEYLLNYRTIIKINARDSGELPSHMLPLTSV
jgi:hypothetical protein